MNPVAITGVGAVTPLGNGAQTLHERWAGGACGIVAGVARCDEFDPAGLLSRRELHRTDRFSQLALTACDEALQGAGLNGDLPYAPDRIGCIIGTGMGGAETLERGHDTLLRRGPDAVSSISLPLLMANAAPAMIAIRYGFKGESYSIMSACSGGAQAIGAGADMVGAGRADAVVVGGAEAPLTPFMRAAFARMGALSPSGICRPFDRRRDGFVLGEGAGILVLEDAEHARRRGAEVLGEVVGYAATTDANHLTSPEPEGSAAALAIERALESGGLNPGDVDYVNAHGTSTPLNDPAETRALKRALAGNAERVPISSTKSAIGHLLGAAGAVEAIATLMALRHGTAPPTLGLEEPEEGLDLDYVPREARKLLSANGGGSAALVGVSNAFAFGGHNAVVVMRARGGGAE